MLTKNEKHQASNSNGRATYIVTVIWVLNDSTSRKRAHQKIWLCVVNVSVSAKVSLNQIVCQATFMRQLNFSMSLMTIVKLHQRYGWIL